MTAPTRARPNRPDSSRRPDPPRPAPTPAPAASVQAAGSWPATAAVTLLTLVAALSMGRLFGGVSRLGPVLIAALLSHLLAWEGRRRRLGTVVSILATLGIVAVVTTWLVIPRTTAYGIPAGRSLHAVSTALSGSLAQFRDVVAPAHPTTGFILASVLGIAITALLSDWAAFRMQATFEAAIPSFTIFLFTALLGTSGGRGLAVASYVAALLLFIALHQADTLSRGTAWFTGRGRGTPGDFLRHAGALGLIAVVAAVVVAPHLPGARAAAILDWRKKDAVTTGGNRVTVSPLVDIRARLVNQANIEVFSVKANSRAYWRLTSLDAFDGSIWSSNGIYRPAHKRLSVTGGSSVATTKITQHYSITALNSTWLPAAYEPTHIGNLAGVGYDELSGSLLPAQPTSDSLDYDVESDVSASHLTPALLEGTSGAKVPAAISKRYLPLPAIPPAVLAEAQRVAGTGSPYQRARALEDYFRSGAFTYDLNVPGGHDDRAMERFLFRTKRGFCEQFAGTYAVMARAVGLPTRVAVGFTPGEVGADGQTFRVFSLNAHAWPEVWMGTAGWVAFEPTPGRGVPGGQAYTGVPEAQAQPEATTTPTSALGTATTTGTTATTDPTTRRSRIQTSAPKRTGRPGGLVWVLVAAAVVLGLWVTVVPGLYRTQSRRRQSGARSPGQQVLVAFDDAERALAHLGRGRRPAETPTEWAGRANREAHLPTELATALIALASQAGAAWFSLTPVTPEAVGRSRATARAVESHVRSRSTRRQRLSWALDPRPLLAGWVASSRPPRGSERPAAA